ncbi:MAG: hypothetical protein ACRDL5_17990 [Solirubrobacteraceae bacterium]
MLLRRWIVLLTLCVVGLALPSAAQASKAGSLKKLQGAAAITLINRQRAANGIPPITTVNPAFAGAWCPNEDNGPSGGEEDRDLAPTLLWGPDLTPWIDAPLHEYPMYDPLLTSAGDVNRDARACFGAGGWTEADNPTTPKFYAFVAPNGPRHAPISMEADELPTTPNQMVGLRAGGLTGPEIILYATGMGIGTTSTNPNVPPQFVFTYAASVMARRVGGGVVHGVRIADSKSPGGNYLGVPPDSGGVLVFPHPLRPHTSYTVTVVWHGAIGTATQHLRFTTGTTRITRESPF